MSLQYFETHTYVIFKRFYKVYGKLRDDAISLA